MPDNGPRDREPDLRLRRAHRRRRPGGRGRAVPQRTHRGRARAWCSRASSRCGALRERHPPLRRRHAPHRHVTTNVAVEVDDDAGSARASYYTVFQQTDELRSSRSSPAATTTPSTASTAMVFDTRAMFVDLKGDLSHHLLFELRMTDSRGRWRWCRARRAASAPPSWNGSSTRERRSSAATSRRMDGGVVCDVRDADACAAAVAETLDRHGRLDVLANVAGVAAGNRIEDVTPDEWRRVIDVNLTGTFLLSQAALAALCSRPPARSSTWRRSPASRPRPTTRPTAHRRAA